MKKIVSLTLSLLMVLSSIIFAPFYSNAAARYDCSEKLVYVSTYDELKNELETYTQTGETIVLNNGIIKDGTKGENCTIKVANPNTVTLDLNGYDLSINSGYTSTIFNFDTKTTFFVIDSKKQDKKIRFNATDAPSGSRTSIVTLNNYNASFITMNVNYYLNSYANNGSIVKDSQTDATIFYVTGGDVNIKGGLFKNYFDDGMVLYYKDAQSYNLDISGEETMLVSEWSPICISSTSSGPQTISLYDVTLSIFSDSDEYSTAPRINLLGGSSTKTISDVLAENNMEQGSYSVMKTVSNDTAIQGSNTWSSLNYDVKVVSNDSGQNYAYKSLILPHGHIYLTYETDAFAGFANHSMVLQSSEKAATCENSGLTSGYNCSDCDYQIRQEEIPALGHNCDEKISKATLSADGKIVTYCKNCEKEFKTEYILSPKNIALSTTKYTYDGKVKTPSVIVKDSIGRTLVKGTDYTVSYASGRKNVGKYAVKITFKGKYSGTKTLYFTIVPKTTSISKLTALKAGFKATVKKQATQTTGYQIQYSTSSKMTSAKTVTISKNTTLSKTVSKLKKGKKYYVRVRTYKTVSGTKYYSAWSAKKYVTTKK